MYVVLFSILWHISGNFSYYYAGVMLDAHESLLCSKLWQHNVDNPSCNTFFFLFSPSFSKAIGLQNCHSCVMSFLLLLNFFSVPHFAMTVFMCICLHKQRKMSFEFSSILSTVDLDWSFKTFNHGLNHSKIHTARQFCDFQSFFFFFGNRVLLNLYERALSGNELFS